MLPRRLFSTTRISSFPASAINLFKNSCYSKVDYKNAKTIKEKLEIFKIINNNITPKTKNL